MSRLINAGYWKIDLTSSGVLAFTIGTHAISAPSVAGDGSKWVHVAATYDGMTARLYVNGQSVASTTFGALSLAGGPVDGGAGGLGPTIGATYDNVVAYDMEIFGSRIDEMTLYNRALTAAEVGALAAGQRPARR
jgi:hypothetical protein